jgi:hypothetical protein
MSRICQYSLLAASDSGDLETRVNEQLELGWEPIGGPAAHHGQLVQAMVLSTDSEKRIRKTSED